MKSVFLIVLAFGFSLGAQPGVWRSDTCPPYAERDNYIILGEDAPDGKYPYQVSLHKEASKSHTCGASILTKNWVMTAAHCCMPSRGVYVYAGSNSLSKGGKIHRINSTKVHENYQPHNRWRNDICLIKLNDPFVFGPRVQKVILPPQNFTLKDGDRVNITGWGLTEPEGDRLPDKLQLGKNFVYLSPQKCYNETGALHESYLCVKGGKDGQGVCNGDSGSPLVRNGVQFGIASWVFLPCGCELPDFYARVPNFIDWIKKTLGKDAAELQFMK